ncbi:thermonuclease family protein [Halorhabdus amylolytica]|uniref:thermonuclease family protein n=1 Tax=Halorhabdus amylolytica TaxID=2559573 RepID=UPI0010AA10EC|nr:thermonuclease family protein [Halorhabdus amylolytica]
MDGRLVVVIALVALAGCSGLPGGQPDATTAPPSDAPVVESPLDGATATTLPSGDSWTVTVVDVIDGDTMEIEYTNGTRETIRLLGVDTPEPYAGVTPAEWDGIPETAAGRAWLAGWADNASAFAQQRLAGQDVRIVTDGAAGRRGGYGRLLVYVVIDGEVFGEQLLEGGYARRYETAFALYGRFSDAEARAQAADRGIWGFGTD